MDNTALDYNNLPNSPREMRQALFKRYLAKLGGLGIYDLSSLEKIQGKVNGFQDWLYLPLSICLLHEQSSLIQEEEGMALAAALWWLTRDKRIQVRSRMIFARWMRVAKILATYNGTKGKSHQTKNTEKIIYLAAEKWK